MFSLNSKIVRKILAIIVFIISLYTIAIVFIALPKIDATVNTLEENNAQEILQQIVLLTNNVAKNLEDFKEESLNQHKKELKNIIGIVYSMMNEAYIKAVANPKDQDKIKQEVLDRISSIRYGYNNYVFVFDYNCTILVHPFVKKGTNMKNVLDIKGEPVVPRMLKVAREFGEGYTRYWWSKNNGDPNPIEKLSYAKDFPQWQMIVGTGMYIDDIEKEVQKRKQELFSELKSIMQSTKVGKTGYIYIFDEHKMLIHPNSNIEGKDFRKLKNPGKNSYIYDDLVKAAHTTGVLRYKWDKPSDKGHYVYDKISWIKYIPSMKLYVVSSAYVSELEEISRCLHNKILRIALLILLLSFIVSSYYIRKLLQPIHELAKTAEVIANGNYDIRAIAKTDDEIGNLAKNFNIMVDKLQDHIQNLDKKIQEKTEELKSLAITDPLTKLYNRRYFSEISSELFELDKREGKALSVIMIDIDKFKNINDTYGHQAGDIVIEKLASMISYMKRESDIACRYGGEEFVLLLPKTTKEGAYKFAQRLRTKIEQTVVRVAGIEEHITFTISIGVSEVNYSTDTHIETVLKRADDAMYQAKNEGRNKVCII